MWGPTAKKTREGAPLGAAPSTVMRLSNAMRPVLDPEADQQANVVLISVLGLVAAARDAAVEASLGPLQDASECPVFVSDDPDFTVFLKHSLFYEYLPPIADQLRYAAGLRWDLYITERVRIILAKWQPKRMESPGLSLQAFVVAAAAAHRPAPCEF